MGNPGLSNKNWASWGFIGDLETYTTLDLNPIKMCDSHTGIWCGNILWGWKLFGDILSGDAIIICNQQFNLVQPSLSRSRHGCVWNWCVPPGKPWFYHPKMGSLTQPAVSMDQIFGPDQPWASEIIELLWIFMDHYGSLWTFPNLNAGLTSLTVAAFAAA